MNMTERASKVIRDYKPFNDHYGMAKAVIKAMREPTEEMLKAGNNACGEGVGADEAWPAMIDAALNETEEKK